MNHLEQKLGIAMYTVRKSVAEDMEGSFLRLAELGYRGIEFYGDYKQFELKQVQSALRASGLALTGWHIEWRDLQDDNFSSTVEYLNKVKCPLAIIPCLGGKWNIAHAREDECLDVWLRHIEWLSSINERLAKTGLRTGYHNHAHEFVHSYESKSVFELLFDNLSEDIIMELDSGNCIEGGGDPLRVLEKYANREIILHLKPFSQENGFDTILGAFDDLNNWTAMLAQTNWRFQWMLLESENNVLPEFENAELCIDGFCRLARGDHFCIL
jgi:sugar phosphate isomerase/epimerase